MKRKIEFFGLRLILLFSATFQESFAQQQKHKPNVLFLFVDDQRADTLGASGNPTSKPQIWTNPRRKEAYLKMLMRWAKITEQFVPLAVRCC